MSMAEVTFFHLHDPDDEPPHLTYRARRDFDLDLYFSDPNFPSSNPSIRAPRIVIVREDEFDDPNGDIFSQYQFIVHVIRNDAALKRAQAYQRRGCIEQQQQRPLLTIKVELEQLIISISIRKPRFFLGQLFRRSLTEKTSRLHFHSRPRKQYISRLQASELLRKVRPFIRFQMGFRQIVNGNLSLWNAILVGYFRAGQFDKVLRWYVYLRQWNIWLDNGTITFALKSCIELGDLGFGRRIHGDALKSRCSSNGFVGSSLMGLYSRCGFVKDAAEVLDEITERDIVVYTSIITGYGQSYKRLAASRQLAAY